MQVKQECSLICAIRGENCRRFSCTTNPNFQLYVFTWITVKLRLYCNPLWVTLAQGSLESCFFVLRQPCRPGSVVSVELLRIERKRWLQKLQRKNWQISCEGQAEVRETGAVFWSRCASSRNCPWTTAWALLTVESKQSLKGVKLQFSTCCILLGSVVATSRRQEQSHRRAGKP